MAGLSSSPAAATFDSECGRVPQGGVLPSDAHVSPGRTIKSNGGKIGKLLISNGKIEWLPKGHDVNKCHLWCEIASGEDQAMAPHGLYGGDRS